VKNTLRTFVAIETSDAVRQRVAELIAVLSGTGAKVSWVHPDNLHLTLKFLDEVPLRLIPEVSDAVRNGAAAVQSFELEIQVAGAFPRASRPRTVWLGMGEGNESLALLHATVEKALEPIGFPKDGRRFAAHLTLGRVRGQIPGLDEFGTLIRQHANFRAGRFPVRELVVFSSQLTPQGPIYEALSRATLRSP
jgi:RNA 2',3'-cyclic 3'-phosphodiesterase